MGVALQTEHRKETMATIGLLAILIVGTVGIARLHMSFQRVFFGLVGFFMGAVVGGAPGACFLFPALSANSAEPFPFHLVAPGLVFVCGSVMGALAGVIVMDRAISHRRTGRWTWLLMLCGLVLGGAISLTAVGCAGESWARMSAIFLGPLMVASASLAAYSLGSARG